MPAWFGLHDVAKSLKLGQTFTAPGLLALVAVGQAGRMNDESTGGAECEVGMQMKLRPSGFSREEAKELAAEGFRQLKLHKLVRQVKKPREEFPYGWFKLSKKGTTWYELIERSAGCAPV